MPSATTKNEKATSQGLVWSRAFLEVGIKLEAVVELDWAHENNL